VERCGGDGQIAGHVPDQGPLRRGGRHMTAICTVDGGLFTRGGRTQFGMSRGDMLGHGAGEHTQEMSPRLVEALVGKTVVGVTAGDGHTAAWTEEIELFTLWAWRLWAAWPRRGAGRACAEAGRSTTGEEGGGCSTRPPSQRCGRRQENSSPLGLDPMGSLATEGGRRACAEAGRSTTGEEGGRCSGG
jgi:hypothetical protein